MESLRLKRVLVNGQHREVSSEHLFDLLAELGYGEALVATAVNGRFIAREQRRDTALQIGDAIEILAPMQGG